MKLCRKLPSETNEKIITPFKGNNPQEFIKIVSVNPANESD